MGYHLFAYAQACGGQLLFSLLLECRKVAHKMVENPVPADIMCRVFGSSSVCGVRLLTRGGQNQVVIGDIVLRSRGTQLPRLLALGWWAAAL